MDDAIVERIHGSGRRIALAITGGGSGVIARLLRVPGGSRTLVEAVVPYTADALVDFLGHAPEQACSVETAVAMARRALASAERRSERNAAVVGVGVTASLATDRPKRGAHRCHIAVTDGGVIDAVSITLDKGARDRAGEEDLVARATLLVLAAACGVQAAGVDSLLGPNDRASIASVSDPVAACELALDLQRTLVRDPQLPAARMGLAGGPVVSHRGDYYGDVVNLAARLVKAAEPGQRAGRLRPSGSRTPTSPRFGPATSAAGSSSSTASEPSS